MLFMFVYDVLEGIREREREREREQTTREKGERRCLKCVDGATRLSYYSTAGVLCASK
jgi:hypothetical protein